MDPETDGSLFNIREAWRQPQFHPEPSDLFSLFATPKYDLDFTAEDSPYAANTGLEGTHKLVDLDSFQYGAVRDASLPDESTRVTDDSGVEEPGEVEGKADEPDDIWDFVVDDVAQASSEVKTYSWEAFQTPSWQEPASAYLSEAGTDVWNVALRMHEVDKEDLQEAEVSVIKGDVFVQSLFALGLGRSSALFRYDAGKKMFTQMYPDYAASGYSKQAVQEIVQNMSLSGRLVRHLRDFIDRTYAAPKVYPARVALAKAISCIVDAIELHITRRAGQITTVLQLQAAFARPSSIIVEIYDLARAVRNARSNEDLATLVYKRCQLGDQEPEWLRCMMLNILARVSRPWLELAEQWVGFREDTTSLLEHLAFIEVDPATSVKDEKDNGDTPQELKYVIKPEKIPAFLSHDEGQRIFGLGRDIRILRAHHPEHPVAQSKIADEQDISLEWHFEWDAAERVVAKAKSFEAALVAAVQESKTRNETATTDECEASEVVLAADNESGGDGPFAIPRPETFNAWPSHGQQLPDELTAIILDSLDHDKEPNDLPLVDFSPPTTITPVLSFSPLLSAQQRIVNAVMMRLFFRSHNLRLHLDLQRSFHLFGDGVFVSRLTAALFDPDADSTERERGVMRSGQGMGLRLGSRGTWPPASSELRLALMGILSDCYEASLGRKLKNSGPKLNPHDLPGSLSFAIRHLEDAEAQQILDANSLHALDFLRLQYTPPPPLGAILTPAALDRYDTIFKSLLRLNRLLFVVAHLPSTALTSPVARTFRHQATHFVNTCCKYFFDTGVRETWDVFAAYLSSIESRLREGDDAQELGTRVAEGVEDLRRMHELCLERMAFALLLRNRQQKVMGVFEEVLGCVLEFSRVCHDAKGGLVDSEGLERLFGKFSDNVSLFIEVCRGLVGKKGYGKGGGHGRDGFGGGLGGSSEENTIERLVVALDQNGFYEKKR